MRINGRYYANYEDYESGFWNNNYAIRIDSMNFVANANNAQEAIDYVIDYCEWFRPGMLMRQDEVEQEEHLDDYICGGNHCRYINSLNVNIEKIFK